jgi:quinol-cytochrome oxidoreductase complex cytochrome b subunit
LAQRTHSIRLGAAKAFLKRAHPQPYAQEWWFCLGGTPLHLFLIQLISGIALTFYFIPDPGKAFESLRYITEEVPFSWWVRRVHR